MIDDSFFCMDKWLHTRCYKSSPDAPSQPEAGKRWEIRSTLTGWHEEGNTCGFVLGGFFELDVVEGASTVKGFSLAGDSQI